MGLYKKGNIYWFKKVFKRKKYEESLGTGVRKLAEKLYAEKLTAILDGTYSNGRGFTLKDMITRYEQEYTDYRSYHPKARDKSIFNHLYTYFGENTLLVDIEDTIGGYEHYRRTADKSVKGKGIRKTPAAPATIVKELGLLRRMFNIARKQWKWKITNPVSEIELPKVKNERVRYLFPEEYQRMMKALKDFEPSWLRPLVYIALDTGLRLSNLCDLRWSDVYFSLPKAMIAIEAEKMKNDAYIGIPLTERAIKILEELKKAQSVTGHIFHDHGEPLYDRKIQRAFKNLLVKAQIINFHFHDLRHHFCSSLRQRGADLHVIGELAGHRDLRMTRRYAHLNVDCLRDTISLLNKSATEMLQS